MLLVPAISFDLWLNAVSSCSVRAGKKALPGPHLFVYIYLRKSVSLLGTVADVRKSFLSLQKLNSIEKEKKQVGKYDMHRALRFGEWCSAFIPGTV